MKLNCTEPITWAQLSNYAIQETDGCYRGELNLVHSEYPAFRHGAMEVASTAYKDPYYVHATDVKLIVVNNDRKLNSHNYKYFIISKDNNLLIDSNLHRKHWAHYFRFFSFIDDTNLIFNESYLENEISLADSDQLVFVGGHSHFGHWLADHLPTILYSTIYPVTASKTQFLVSKLNSFQVETITECKQSGIFAEIDVGEAYLTIFNIPRLSILFDLSICKSYELVRNALGIDSLIPDTSSGKISNYKRRVYLERGVQRGANRLVNEQEVIEMLSGHNFEILKPHEMSIASKREIFVDVDLFVCPPASAYFNFYFFSNNSSHLIYLIHESALHNTDAAVFGGSYYQSKDLFRTTLFPATQPTVNVFGRPVYDAPCFVDVEKLEHQLRTMLS